MLVRYFKFILILTFLIPRSCHGNAWEKPGCHKIGYTRKVSFPGCVEFHVTTNACRGYCLSWSIPSALDTLLMNPNQVVTSVGQCCNIMETEEVLVKVKCVDEDKGLIYRSAKSCSCYHCKKD